MWHHYLITGDRDFVDTLWPSVQGGLDFVVDMQSSSGEIWWARGENGQDCPEALLTGNSSIHHSLHCGLLLARLVDDPQPEWEFAKYTLGHAIRQHPEAFAIKDEYSMDWYYPILGGAVRGEVASDRIASRWDDFVVEGLGIRCVDHRPWVTGAETCELVLALDAMGNTLVRSHSSPPCSTCGIRTARTGRGSSTATASGGRSSRPRGRAGR